MSEVPKQEERAPPKQDVSIGVDTPGVPTAETEAPAEEGEDNPMDKKEEQVEATVDDEEKPSSTEATVDPTTEAAVDPTTESAVDPTTESAVDPTTESAVDPTTEAAVDPTTDAAVYPTTEKPDDSAENNLEDAATEQPDDEATEKSDDFATVPIDSSPESVPPQQKEEELAADEEKAVAKEEEAGAMAKEEPPAPPPSKGAFEAVGQWFQKFSGGGGGSRGADTQPEIERDEALPQLRQDEAETQEFKAEDPANVVIASDESEKPEEPQAEDAPAEASEEGPTDNKQAKQAGWAAGVGTLFGTKPKSEEDDEPLEIHPEKIKVEEETTPSWGGLFGSKVKKDEENPDGEATPRDASVDAKESKTKGPGWGSAFRRNKKVGAEDEGAKPSSEGGNDDENEKKKGGFRQKSTAFYRSSAGKIAILACTAVIVLLVVMIPILLSAGGSGDDMDSFFRKVGKVNKNLQAEMIKHPAYKGDLNPSGQISLRFDVEDRFLATFRVNGLDQSCSACTWVMQSGSTCHDETQLGELYYDHQDPALLTLNPFMHTHYATKDGISETGTVIYNGYNLDENENRLIVLNDIHGNAAACGVLKKFGHPETFPKLWANVRSLPEYAAKSEVDVKVRLDFYPDHAFHMGLTGTGLPPNCGMCQVAIYTGTSCRDPEGETLWKADLFPYDPWGAVSGAYYSTNGEGVLSSRPGFYFFDGFEYGDHMKHVVIFRDGDNVAIACGELEESKTFVWTDVQTAFFQNSIFGRGGSGGGSSLIHGYLRNADTVMAAEIPQAAQVIEAGVEAGVETVASVEHQLQG